MNDELVLDGKLVARVLGAIMDRMGVPMESERGLDWLLLRNELREVYDATAATEILAALTEFGDVLVNSGL